MPCKNCECKRCVAYYAQKQQQPEPFGQEINSVLDKFYDINPSLNYANKGNRNAALFLIQKFGVEKTMQVVDYAISVQSEKYAPTITTPHQLKEKLAALFKHYRDNQAQQKTLVSI